METKTQEKLVDIYRQTFINSYEEGGGYGFRFHHGVRVMTYCEKFLNLPEIANLQINREALLAAALFHDIGKVKAMNSNNEIIYGSEADKNHEQIGSEIVRSYIGDYISNPETMTLIEQIIKDTDDSTQSSNEAKLIKDADRLDNYGYQVVWRHITGTTHNKRTDNILDLEKYWVNTGAKEKAKNYLNDFNFDPIRQIATKRYNDFNTLIDQIDTEVNGRDIINQA